MEITLEQALSTEGWMSPDELAFLAETAAKVPATGAIVEVGSYKGRSACALAANTQATVYCVDTWRDGEPYGVHIDLFRANTAKFPNIVPVHLASVDAAHVFKGERFDMIFIDAFHDEQNVRQDIAAWRPRLKEGGVFCGHDYGFTGWPDVKLVVDELFPGVRVVDTIWIAP